MPPAKSLSMNIQVKRAPLIKERNFPNDEEEVCCYCGQRFLEGNTKWRKTWEHLDNDETNQELWNLDYAHWHCNEKKKHDADLQILAREIIKKNQQWEETFDFDSTRARERKNPITTDEQTQIDLNVAHHEICENFLTEKITEKNPRIEVSDTISCIALRCRKQTGHGSAQSIRNYLNVLSCSEGDYKIEKVEGKNYILRRTRN